MSSSGLFIDSINDRRKKTNYETVILGIIPWFHAFGCLTIIGVILSGTLLVSLPKFEDFLFLTCIEVSCIDDNN